ncbi:MAG TPA: HRDC domain-containing protein [Rhodanobacteraceae bacterium]|jgi:ribonuclease D|nr:HRDC domain-containing protein [Rhodanobacteraceae bacterium]
MTAAWIDQAGRVATFDDRDPVGLDTEFMRRNTFFPRLALVQAAHHAEHWLLDPLAYDAGPDVRSLVAGRCCIMHSAGEDMEALAPLLVDVPLRLFDTQIAAALCGMGPGLSYQKLVAGLLGIEISKDETRSDWLQRPLTASQRDYAELDVAYLAELHGKLSGRLTRLGRREWHAEDCERLVRRADRRRGADPQPQKGFPAASDWPPELQARLRRILLWRDEVARTLDKPRPWLLDDAHALNLAQQLPPTPQALFDRVKGQRALRGPQRAALFALLQAPATPEELSELSPIPPAPRGEYKKVIDAMRLAVQAVAARHELPPGLLCPRRLVVEFATTRVWPEGLEGWRRALLEEVLAPLLPD